MVFPLFILEKDKFLTPAQFWKYLWGLVIEPREPFLLKQFQPHAIPPLVYLTGIFIFIFLLWLLRLLYLYKNINGLQTLKKVCVSI
jgi:hypothetical protein